MKHTTTQKGFTLVELLLYVAIAGSLLLLTTAFLFMLLEARVKNQTIAEVEQQGLQVMQNITQSVRNAEGITAPTVGGSSPSLTLDVVSGVDDPTVYTLNSGTIEVTEGGGGAVALTNTRVTASGLSFENLSRAGTPGVIRVSFTLTHVNPDNRQEYTFSKTFYASASVR
ncbi:prepilin-type N-terminal cleavage/methylation domain-containing protein [Candidatus Kaiserbacteria bacterium]|nr:prepilin-type N-terminal cleavage/methylation domain-containing protein [Candidatus Kaiserbacteria bacterium]